jgi:uncharacterized protein (TIGR03435 family)
MTAVQNDRKQQSQWNLSAKPDKPATPSEVTLMLQGLLADHFGLALHRETRNLPIYTLVIARRHGKLGPSLVQSKDGGCTTHNLKASGDLGIRSHVEIGNNGVFDAFIDGADTGISNV